MVKKEASTELHEVLIVDALCAPLNTKVKYGWQALQRMCPHIWDGAFQCWPARPATKQIHRFRAVQGL